MSDPQMFPEHTATEGELVVALLPITEGGFPHSMSLAAKFPEKNYVHALAGDTGRVVGIDSACGVTVRFDRTGTATLISVHKVGWLVEVEDNMAKFRVYRGDGTFRKAQMSLGERGRDKPPEGLVQLSTLPRELWVGLNIFHPRMQAGGIPYWRRSDAPEIFHDPEDENPEKYNYDVGVVTKFKTRAEFFGDGWGDDEFEVWFKRPDDKSDYAGLHYGAYNCWTAPLVEGAP